MQEALDKLNAALAALEHLTTYQRHNRFAQRVLLLESVHKPLTEARAALELAMGGP